MENNKDKEREKARRIYKVLSSFRKQYDQDRKSFAKEKFPVDVTTSEGREQAPSQNKKRMDFFRNQGRIPRGFEYKVTNPDKQTANQKIVFDKLSNLNDEDLNKLQSFSNNVAQQFIGKSIPESLNILRKIDLSSIKKIREKANLTKDEILNLIETNENSSILEKASAKAVRAAASLKKFKKGGLVKPIKRKE